jgi:hypothetical protein
MVQVRRDFQKSVQLGNSIDKFRAAYRPFGRRTSTQGSTISLNERKIGSEKIDLKSEVHQILRSNSA